MAPEAFITMEANRLRALASQMEDYRVAKELSQEALIKQFPTLGSSKTFKRILDGDLAELDLDRQLANYQAAVQLMEDMERDMAQVEEDIYDDLSPVIALKRAFLEAKKEASNSRVIFLLGPTGSGKTSARRALYSRYGGYLLLIEASVAWNDSPHAMLSEILRALGVKSIPSTPLDRLNRVVDMLRETRRGLIIEEAHHLGARCLNLVKTLVNQTPGEFLLIGIDTIWRRLETANYEECRQLTGNRLKAKVLLPSECKAGDITKLITRRLPHCEAFAAKWASAIGHHAANYGRFAFVRNVLARAAELTAPEADSITACITEEIKRR